METVQDGPNQFVILNQILLYLFSHDDEKISNILTQIRALRGVVTLSIAQATTKYSQTEHITKLRLKFLASAKSAQVDLKSLKSSISGIHGVTHVIIKLNRFQNNNQPQEMRQSQNTDNRDPSHRG